VCKGIVFWEMARLYLKFLLSNENERDFLTEQFISVTKEICGRLFVFGLLVCKGVVFWEMARLYLKFLLSNENERDVLTEQFISVAKEICGRYLFLFFECKGVVFWEMERLFLKYLLSKENLTCFVTILSYGYAKYHYYLQKNKLAQVD
jgi:hypothetical protein